MAKRITRRDRILAERAKLLDAVAAVQMRKADLDREEAALDAKLQGVDIALEALGEQRRKGRAAGPPLPFVEDRTAPVAPDADDDRALANPGRA